MIQRGLGMFLVAGLLASALPAHAIGNVRRETTAYRPYIVEVGEPYEISMETLQVEAESLSELEVYLKDYGYPDYAEVQEIEPQWPWAPREVRVYYLRRNLEADFGHVIVSSALTTLGVAAYVNQIPPEKAHQIELILEARRTQPPVPAPVAMAAAPVPAATASGKGWLNEALVARIEAAAERASQAADRAVSESDAAVSAADRTENIVNQLEQSAGTRARRR